MKWAVRIASFLLVCVFLFSLCSCLKISPVISAPTDKTGNTTDPKPSVTEKIYSATYDLNYDDKKVVASYTSSEGYTPQSPTRPGYRFLYWTLNGTPVDGTIPVGYSGDITLVAVWEIITYRLIYENLTESEFASLPKTFTIENAVEIPDPERVGFRFLGWNTALEKNLTIPAGQTGDYILRANWASLTLQFSAAANVDTVSVSTSYSDQTLQIGTVIHASAPVYEGNYHFLHWELNGKTVCTSAIYSFPLSSEITRLRAIYEYLSVVEWTKTANVNLNIPNLLSKKPGLILGASIKEGDYLFTDTGVTLKAAYLKTLDPGNYSFYIAALSGENEVGESLTFILRIQGDPSPKAGYDGMPNAGKSYLAKTVSYRGEQLPLVASTDEEFRKLVEYCVLVGGILKLQKNGATTGEYQLDVYIWGDLNKRMQNGEKILSAAAGSVSFPMNPELKLSYAKDPEAVGTETTIEVSYSKGINNLKSSQAASAMPDRQGLLTSPGRAEGFDAFPIDALTETVTIQTLYELEVLPFGKKPVFASTASDAQQIYQIARGILREIVDNSMDDYEKVKAIYYWIAMNLTYDKETASNPEKMTTTAYTLKGALVDRLAVCDGYASAFRLLCQIEGIRAEEVIGLRRIEDATSGHAWNKVWIGGAVFGVDCTWARQKLDDYEIVTSSFLLLDEAGLIRYEHYENATSGSFWVKDIANASILLPATVALDSVNHTFVIHSQIDFYALIAYLKNHGLQAAEFYLADDTPMIFSTPEYIIYESGNYGYLFFRD